MDQQSAPKSFEPPRGMRDFYPADMARREHIFDSWRKAAAICGFSQYDACVVESLELLQRKAGEEVSEQIYNFEDKGGRKLALRAEMTPTLARMVAAKQGSLSFPLKWSAIAQCFRYERMTKGRKREHYQWNIDIVGEDSVLAEAEVLNAAATAMRIMGMPDSGYRIHVSSRALLGELLNAKGFDKSRHGGVFLALDKRGKLSDDAISALLAEEGFSPCETAKVFELTELSSVEAVEAVLGETQSLKRLKDLFAIAEEYGFADRLLFDISVIRGLSYYTGIVFEAFDSNRKFRAIFGGGRYDNLLTSIGGNPTPAVGLGFGDVVIGEVLKELCPDMGQKRVDGISIGYMTDAEQLCAARLARRFRQEGKRVDLSLSARKPKNFFKYAGEGNLSHAVYIGPDDVLKGCVRLKNLETREESEIPLV